MAQFFAGFGMCSSWLHSSMGSFHSSFSWLLLFVAKTPPCFLTVWCGTPPLVLWAAASCWCVLQASWPFWSFFCVLHRGRQADIARNQKQVTDLPLPHNLTLRRRQPYQFEFTKPQKGSNIIMLCVCLRECMADRPNIQSKCLWLLGSDDVCRTILSLFGWVAAAVGMAHLMTA